MSRAAKVEFEAIRPALAARLRERAGEIEAGVLARVRALSDPAQAGDPEYSAGLREAVKSIVDYAIAVVENGPDWSEPVPSAAAAQARRAARNGVSLDTVLRRYAAGDRLLGEFIMDEVERFSSQPLRRVMSAQAAQLDRLMAAVAAEYLEEREQMQRSSSQRLAEQVQRLLAADGRVDSAALGYELDAWHLGMVAVGAAASMRVQDLAGRLGRQLLAVPRGDAVWAWLGGRLPLAPDRVEHAVSGGLRGTSLAIGEPRHGLDGWRLTHHEAQAAVEVMLRSPRTLTRGSDSILVAALLRSDVLAKSLLETYIAPLGGNGYSSLAIRETLRAYFATGRNAAAAAAALGVDRHTVQRRLRKAEAAVGRRLESCHSELEVALRLEGLIGGPSEC